MEIRITQDSFKAQAKKLHAALQARGVELKLSDVQESLAVSLGHRNLAALNGMLKLDASRIVEGTPLYAQKDNLFVVSWVYDQNFEDDQLVVYPYGTDIDDIATRDWRARCALDELVIVVPDEIQLDQAVVLVNYTEVSNISKYGLHDGAHESTVNAWVLEHFNFRVPAEGVSVHVSDRGDDGATKDHFLLWVPDEEAKALRNLFDE